MLCPKCSTKMTILSTQWSATPVTRQRAMWSRNLRVPLLSTTGGHGTSLAIFSFQCTVTGHGR
jgi:hypothetical protein